MFIKDVKPNRSFGKNYRRNYYGKIKSWPPPFFIIVICFAQIVCFYVVQYDEDNEPTIPTSFAWDSQKNNGFWQLLTYSLIHLNQNHLWINTMALICFGLPLEMIHGTRSVITLHILSITFASSLTILITTEVLLIGSSASVYALLTAHLASIMINNRSMPAHGILELFILVVFVVIQLLSTSQIEVNRVVSTSQLSHLAGIVTGLLVSPILLHDFDQRVPSNFKSVAFAFYGLVWIVFELNCWLARQ